MDYFDLIFFGENKRLDSCPEFRHLGYVSHLNAGMECHLREHLSYLHACKTQALPEALTFLEQQLETSQDTAETCVQTADLHPCTADTPHLELSQEESYPTSP